MLLVGRWFAADVHAALAVALGVPVLVVEAVHGFVGSGPVLAFAAGYLGLQVGLGLVLDRTRGGVVGVARLLLAVAFVGGLELIEPRAEATLPVLYVPIIVLAAALSGRAGLIVSVAAVSVARLALVIQEGTEAALDQSVLPLVVVAFLAVGTRHVVASLERSVGRLRRVVAI